MAESMRIVLNTSSKSSQALKNNLHLDRTVFANEDVSKPENRINLSMFGLLLNNEFREWFLLKLELPIDAVVFPSANIEGGIRPDFAVHNKDDKPIAYIEVEIGKEDIGQLQNYRSKIRVPILSICGRQEHKCSLSLIEIYNKLKDLNNLSSSMQFQKNFAVFETLIIENIMSFRRERYKSTTVSAKMKKSTIVKRLFENLDIHENVGRMMYPREILIETKKEFGFSLRIYSARSKVRKSLAVMSRSVGREEIIFPSRQKLVKYLEDGKQRYIDEYSLLLNSIGCSIDHIPERNQGRVKIGEVEKILDQLILMINKLAAV